MTSSYMSEAFGLGIKAVAAATHLSILDVLACGGGRKCKKTMMSPRTAIFSTFRFFAPLDLSKLFHLPHTKQTFNIQVVCQSLFWFAYFFCLHVQEKCYFYGLVFECICSLKPFCHLQLRIKTVCYLNLRSTVQPTHMTHAQG